MLYQAVSLSPFVSQYLSGGHLEIPPEQRWRTVRPPVWAQGEDWVGNKPAPTPSPESDRDTGTAEAGREGLGNSVTSKFW